jgi:chemotaxis protein MotB
MKPTLTGEGTEEVKKKEEEEKKEEAALKRQLVKVGKDVKKEAENARMSDDVSIISTKDGLKVRVKGEALFTPGSTKIDRKAVRFLDAIVGVLKKTGFDARVEGHTDNIPFRPRSLKSVYTSNWELSGARAAVIARYFVLKGVDPFHLSAVGYADMDPLVSNKTKEGRAKNRRVEFLIKKPVVK